MKANLAPASSATSADWQCAGCSWGDAGEDAHGPGPHRCQPGAAWTQGSVGRLLGRGHPGLDALMDREQADAVHGISPAARIAAAKKSLQFARGMGLTSAAWDHTDHPEAAHRGLAAPRCRGQTAAASSGGPTQNHTPGWSGRGDIPGLMPVVRAARQGPPDARTADMAHIRQPALGRPTPATYTAASTSFFSLERALRLPLAAGAAPAWLSTNSAAM